MCYAALMPQRCSVPAKTTYNKFCGERPLSEVSNTDLPLAAMDSPGQECFCLCIDVLAQTCLRGGDHGFDDLGRGGDIMVDLGRGEGVGFGLISCHVNAGTKLFRDDQC